MTENQADLGFAFPILSQKDLPMSSPKASPIFCNYNQNVIDFLNTWVQECKQSIEKNEHFFVPCHTSANTDSSTIYTIIIPSFEELPFLCHFPFQ